MGIPERIQGCLTNEGFSKEEEIRALKLLTLVYIFTDNDAMKGMRWATEFWTATVPERNRART